jgi:glutamyl-Q tRNA(Asp) synthetase
LNKRGRGRFAPSPSGALHFGSLIAAVGSFLQARCQGQEWLVRIEDIDTPRVVDGAAAAILRTLDCHGLHWDHAVSYQSRRIEYYQDALQRLLVLDRVYPCTCSRRELAHIARLGSSGRIYPGLCRNGPRHARRPAALRLRTDQRLISFHDRIQGDFSQRLEAEIGDFVIRRSDGIFTYQLAVVVDDAEQGITTVVRGSDLLDSTPRQIYLQHLLGYPTPDYYHLPVAIKGDGAKLSKQTGAQAIDDGTPLANILAALAFLGQQPPAELAHTDLDTLWNWARRHWDETKIAPTPTIEV